MVRELRYTFRMEYRKVKGIHFIRVKGSLEERVGAYGKLLRNQIRDGVAAHLAAKNELLIRRASGLLQVPAIQKAALMFYRNVFMKILEGNMLPPEKRMIQALATETGLSYEEWRNALYQPDAMMVLAKIALIRYLLPEWVPGGLPGCTSAVVAGNWTRSGKILSCRNLDYPTVGYWEKYPTAVFHEPVDKGDIPYVALTTAGIPSGALTSINREGLTLFAHAHFSSKVSLRGRSIVLIGDDVIRKARTIGQVVDEVKKSRRCGNWSFMITSAQEKAAAVVQMTVDKVSVHEAEDGFVSHTNFFHDKKFQAAEGLLSGAYCEDLQGRFCRMREVLEKSRGDLDPFQMCKALGDHEDPISHQMRVMGNTISVVTTVTSAVFEPESLKFWMSNRNESPTGLGDFVGVDIERFWTMSPQECEAEHEGVTEVLSPNRDQDPRLLEAVHYYHKAYCHFHMSEGKPEDFDQCLYELQRATAAYPEDGHLWVQTGILAFQMQRFEEARSSLEQSRSRVLSPHVQAVRDLYLGRCYDLAGERERALELYSAHPEVHEPKLRKAFAKGIKRRYQSHEIGRVVIDLQFPDTFEY